MWAIVQFEDGVSLVAQAWLRKNKQHITCYFPETDQKGKRLTDHTIQLLAKRLEKPMSDWSKYPVKRIIRENQGKTIRRS